MPDSYWVATLCHVQKNQRTQMNKFWISVSLPFLIGKDSDAGRDWGQEEKGMTKDEMAGWHHWLDGWESGWTPGVGDGQGGLACCNSWGGKESDTTERLNWTELNPSLEIPLLAPCTFAPKDCVVVSLIRYTPCSIKLRVTQRYFFFSSFCGSVTSLIILPETL